jgi:hypothetical protein
MQLVWQSIRSGAVARISLYTWIFISAGLVLSLLRINTFEVTFIAVGFAVAMPLHILGMLALRGIDLKLNPPTPPPGSQRFFATSPFSPNLTLLGFRRLRWVWLNTAGGIAVMVVRHDFGTSMLAVLTGFLSTSYNCAQRYAEVFDITT